MPIEVTPVYISSTMQMQENSANTNVIRPLRRIGFVDEKGRLTNRGKAWREDSDYAEVCSELIAEVYPQGLLDVSPPDSFDEAAAKAWFSKVTGAGEVAVRKYVSFYRLVCQKDPNGGAASPVRQGTSDASNKAQARKSTAAKRPTESRIRPNPTTEIHSSSDKARESSTNAVGSTFTDETFNPRPTIHIDIQIHISPESSAEQIDAIFAGMAKHLYQNSPE
jgi:hypothetical protein